MSSTTLPSPALTRAAFLVLLALESGNKHGYAIMTFVEDVTGGAVQLGPGTLYRTIARLVSDGLAIEAEASDPDAPHDDQRRYYAVTIRGRQAAAAEAELLVRLVETAGAAGLLPASSCRPSDQEPESTLSPMDRRSP